MSNRSRTIWHLLIFLTILSLIITAVVAFPVQRDWRNARIRAAEERFGTDQDLEDVIEFLEQRLDQRNRYQFTLEADLLITAIGSMPDIPGAPPDLKITR